MGLKKKRGPKSPCPKTPEPVPEEERGCKYYICPIGRSGRAPSGKAVGPPRGGGAPSGEVVGQGRATSVEVVGQPKLRWSGTLGRSGRTISGGRATSGTAGRAGRAGRSPPGWSGNLGRCGPATSGGRATSGEVVGHPRAKLSGTLGQGGRATSGWWGTLWRGGRARSGNLS